LNKNKVPSLNLNNVDSDAQQAQENVVAVPGNASSARKPSSSRSVPSDPSTETTINGVEPVKKKSMISKVMRQIDRSPESKPLKA
jgi:hypothetical protein